MKHVKQGEYLTCGYSAVGIVAVICVAMVMLLALLVQGLRRYPPGIPLAGMSSAAIAAACHVPDGEDGSASVYKPNRWGVTGYEGETGHCSFSARPVGKPRAGALYA